MTQLRVEDSGHAVVRSTCRILQYDWLLKTRNRLCSPGAADVRRFRYQAYHAQWPRWGGGIFIL